MYMSLYLYFCVKSSIQVEPNDKVKLILRCYSNELVD